MTLSATNFPYNANVQQPEVTVKASQGTVLTKNGSYTVTVTGKGYYQGTVEKTYTIGKQAITAENIALTSTSITYNGAEQTPDVPVTNAAGNKLTKNISYKVSYSSAKKYPGTYSVTVTVTVTGKGNYAGTVSKTFTYTIGKQTLTKANVTLSSTSFTYNGNVQQPTVTVKASQGTVLTKDGSYTVSYSSGCKAKGTYTVTITGKGYYTGTVTMSFTIK